MCLLFLILLGQQSFSFSLIPQRKSMRVGWWVWRSKFPVTQRIIYILRRDFLVHGTELKFLMCSIHQSLVSFWEETPTSFPFFLMLMLGWVLNKALKWWKFFTWKLFKDRKKVQIPTSSEHILNGKSCVWLWGVRRRKKWVGSLLSWNFKPHVKETLKSPYQTGYNLSFKHISPVSTPTKGRPFWTSEPCHHDSVLYVYHFVSCVHWVVRFFKRFS